MNQNEINEIRGNARFIKIVFWTVITVVFLVVVIQTSRIFYRFFTLRNSISSQETIINERSESQKIIIDSRKQTPDKME